MEYSYLHDTLKIIIIGTLDNIKFASFPHSFLKRDLVSTWVKIGKCGNFEIRKNYNFNVKCDDLVKGGSEGDFAIVNSKYALM